MSRKPSQPELLQVDDLEVRLTRKGIRNLHLRVKPPDGRVEVSAPWHLADEAVSSFVRERRGWIERRRAELRDSPQAQAAHATAQEVSEWKTAVSTVVPPLIKEWEPIIGVKAGSVVYRNMKSKWGSCQPTTGRICINTRLALYPPECLEYVVVHELCHLRERGHGPRFRALMDAYLPDWRQRRDKLR